MLKDVNYTMLCQSKTGISKFSSSLDVAWMYNHILSNSTWGLEDSSRLLSLNTCSLSSGCTECTCVDSVTSFSLTLCFPFPLPHSLVLALAPSWALAMSSHTEGVAPLFSSPSHTLRPEQLGWNTSPVLFSSLEIHMGGPLPVELSPGLVAWFPWSDLSLLFWRCCWLRSSKPGSRQHAPLSPAPVAGVSVPAPLLLLEILPTGCLTLIRSHLFIQRSRTLLCSPTTPGTGPHRGPVTLSHSNTACVSPPLHPSSTVTCLT